MKCTNDPSELLDASLSLYSSHPLKSPETQARFKELENQLSISETIQDDSEVQRILRDVWELVNFEPDEESSKPLKRILKDHEEAQF